MSRILSLLVGVLVVLSVHVAHATDLRITCMPPTQNTDGSAITATLSFNLYGGLTGQVKQKLVTGATSCSFTRTAVASGTQEYQVTAVAGGVESAMSNVASAVVPNP